MKTKSILKLLLAVLMVASTGCKEKEPYSPFAFTPFVMAEINGNYSFESTNATIIIAEELNEATGIIGSDSLIAIGIEFKVYCGEQSYNLSDYHPYARIYINGNVESGTLKITNYDMNLVEGTFEFEAYSDSVLQVKNGRFRFIHQYI